MKLKEEEINSLKKDLESLKTDILENKSVYNSTIKTAEILLKNLKYYKDNIRICTNCEKEIKICFRSSK